MTRLLLLVGLVLVTALGGCSKRDNEVLTGKGTAIDTFEFKPKTIEEMSAPRPASGPKSALDDFHFKPKTIAELSAPQPRAPSAPPSALDTFVFVPRTTAEMASGVKAK